MDKMGTYRAWADQFLAETTEPMSKSLTHTFMSLAMLEMDNAPTPPEIAATMQYKILRARSDYLGLKITDHAVVLIGALVDSPGGGIMYLSALKRKQEGSPVKMDITEIAATFPTGFLTEDAMSRMWANQKIESRNLLDSISARDFT